MSETSEIYLFFDISLVSDGKNKREYNCGSSVSNTTPFNLFQHNSAEVAAALKERMGEE